MHIHTQETVYCDVDCSVGYWSEWGECDHYTGTMKRHREVLYEPKHYGAPCPDLWVRAFEYCAPSCCLYGGSLSVEI